MGHIGGKGWLLQQGIEQAGFAHAHPPNTATRSRRCFSASSC
jgi:hypothetical protein